MAKHKLNRKKFIEWASLRNFIGENRKQITEDLIKGGEYILTAQDILDNIELGGIPVYIVIDYRGLDQYVFARDCKLVYIQEID
jgi:hypothetical protein